jgi:hypothetical protein
VVGGCPFGRIALIFGGGFLGRGASRVDPLNQDGADPVTAAGQVLGGQP